MTKITVDTHLKIPLTYLDDKTIEEIKDRYTYVNPEWLSAQKSGYGKFTINQFIHQWEFVFDNFHQCIQIPRGAWRWLNQFLKEKGIKYIFIDKRTEGYPFDIELSPTTIPRPYQKNGIELAKKAQQLVLNYEPGAGKTITALCIIADLKVSTIIIVNSERLMEQWSLEIAKHLRYRDKIGIIQGKKADIRPITIGMVQTLANWTKDDLRKLSARYGILIHDEVHHAPADGIHSVLENFDTKYRIGLTASKTRKDGLEFLIYDYYDKIRQYERGIVLDPTFRFLYTGVKLRLADFGGRWSLLEEELSNNDIRNEFIVENVVNSVENGHIVLLLVNRNNTALTLVDKLNKRNITTVPFIGIRKDMCFNELRERCTKRDIKVVVSCRVFDEGLDIPIFSSIHLGSYQAAEEPLRQRIGRIRRPFEGKPEPEIVVYVDNIRQCLDTSKDIREWLIKFGCKEERTW